MGCISIDHEAIYEKAIVTGNAAGEVYQWIENVIMRNKKIHTAPIDCIVSFDDL